MYNLISNTVAGAYAVWAANQPNYYDNKQFCAVIAMSSFYNYKLVDETCHSYLGFRSLCEIRKLTWCSVHL